MRKNASKQPGSIRFLTGSIKLILAAEVVGMGVFYFFWRKMNVSQDYRYKMYQTYPFLLKGYYSIGELMGGMETRKIDYKAWGVIKDED